MRRWDTLGQILLAPLRGALFVMFLPVIGFVLLVEALVEKVKSLRA